MEQSLCSCYQVAPTVPSTGSLAGRGAFRFHVRVLSERDPAMVLKLVIKVSSGNTIPIEVEPSMKIIEVKELIATQCDVPAAQQVSCQMPPPFPRL